MLQRVLEKFEHAPSPDGDACARLRYVGRMVTKKTVAGSYGAASALFRPPRAHRANTATRAAAAVKARATWTGSPAIRLRPASSRAVAGLTDATAWIHPVSRPSGTYTGARKSTRKTGICIAGPPCIERTRIATPVAHSVAARLTS